MRGAFHSRWGLFGVALASTALIAGGCKGKGNTSTADSNLGTASGIKASTAMTSLADMQEELNVSKQNVRKMISSLQALKTSSSGGGVETAFKTFQTDLSSMTAHAAKISTMSTELQARGAEYRQHWQNEVSKMDNPDLRAGAEERARNVASRFDSIRAKFENTRKDYQPFVRDLNAINDYLSKELNPSAVSVSSGAIDKAIASGEQVTKSLNDLIVEMVSVSVKMAPEAR